MIIRLRVDRVKMASKRRKKKGGDYKNSKKQIPRVSINSSADYKRMKKKKREAIPRYSKNIVVSRRV